MRVLEEAIVEEDVGCGDGAVRRDNATGCEIDKSRASVKGRNLAAGGNSSGCGYMYYMG